MYICLYVYIYRHIYIYIHIHTYIHIYDQLKCDAVRAERSKAAEHCQTPEAQECKGIRIARITHALLPVR
jgi:hypothetical protein